MSPTALILALLGFIKRQLLPITATTMFSIALIVTVVDQRISVRYSPGNPVDIQFLDTYGKTEDIGERNAQPKPSFQKAGGTMPADDPATRDLQQSSSRGVNVDNQPSSTTSVGSTSFPQVWLDDELD